MQKINHIFHNMICRFTLLNPLNDKEGNVVYNTTSFKDY
jgi:hypothetical protein